MKVRRIDFSPDEWIGGTVGLDNAERGLYITACALIYSRGGAVSVDHLRAACRDHGHSFKHQLKQLLALGKLVLNEGQITSKRCSNELQKASERSSYASQNGIKGNKIKKLMAATRSQERDANHQPSTISKKESSLTGAKEGPLAGAARTRRRVPDDWQPDARGVSYALDKAGWIGVRLAEEVEHFHNRSERDGKLFFSIDAGWRTWVQQGAKFDHERNSRQAKKENPHDAETRAFRLVAGTASDLGPDSALAVAFLDPAGVRRPS